MTPKIDSAGWNVGPASGFRWQVTLDSAGRDRCWAADGLAFIGRNPMDEENIYIITGDSGHGMTHGTIGGMLLTD